MPQHLVIPLLDGKLVVGALLDFPREARAAIGESQQRQALLRLRRQPEVLAALRCWRRSDDLFPGAARASDARLCALIEAAIARRHAVVFFLADSPSLLVSGSGSPMPSAGADVAAMTPRDRVFLALTQSRSHMGGALAAHMDELIAQGVLSVILVFLMGLLAANVAHPLVGGAVDGAILLYVAVTVGREGIEAIKRLAEATAAAAAAATPAQIDASARVYAEAIAQAGGTVFLGWLLRRFGSGRGRGGKGGEGGGGNDLDKPFMPPKSASPAGPPVAKTKSRSSLDRPAKEVRSEAPKSKLEEGRDAADEAHAAMAGGVAARQATARSFYEALGWSERRINNHLAGIDFTKPVEIVTLPAGREVVQHVVPGAVGNYFAPVGTAASELGINPAGRTATLFRTTREVQALKSTAAPIIDTWTVPGTPFPAAGGGTQYFVPDPGLFQKVP